MLKEFLHSLLSIKPEIVKDSHIPYAIGTHETNTISLEEYGEKPARIRQSVKFNALLSFCEYINDYSDDRCRIFCNVGQESLTATAILDYHIPAKRGGDNAQPEWGSHKATFQAEPNPDFAEWRAHDRQGISQIQLAKKIERLMHTVLEPDAATLLEMTSHLEGVKKAIFRSGRNMQNGAVSLEYTEEVTTGGGTGGRITVPQIIKIRLRPFMYLPEQEFSLRLRYEIGDAGKIEFEYEFVEYNRVMDDYLQSAKQEIERLSGVKAYFGTI